MSDSTPILPTTTETFSESLMKQTEKHDHDWLRHGPQTEFRGSQAQSMKCSACGTMGWLIWHAD
jgi:hypothetical protein